jgi:hypothetical protein
MLWPSGPVVMSANHNASAVAVRRLEIQSPAPPLRDVS